jgi:hypothetical protein
MKLYRVHPERMRGDDYSGPLDFVEPPAAALFLLALPFGRIPAARWAAGGLLLLLVLAALAPTVEIARAAGARHLVFLPVRVARSFARALGMAAGIAAFWVAAPLRKERG